MPRGPPPPRVTDPARNVSRAEPPEEPLSESNLRYRLLFESNPIPMWMYDVRTLRFVDVNDAAVTKYGYSREEFLAMTIEDIRPAEDVAALRRDVDRARSGGQQVGLWRHRTKDGKLIHVEVSAHDIVLGGGRYRLVLSHDVSERVRADRYRALDFAVSRVLLESETFAEALPKLLETISGSVGWQFGEAWIVSEDRAHLEWAGAWHPSDRALTRFRAESENLRIDPGTGLAGRVWSTGRPAWVSDVAEEAFTRRALAAEVGLHGAFALPIVSHAGVLGVMAFFSVDVQDPDDPLLDLAADLGARIGLFLERERARDAELTVSERFRTIFAANPVPIVLTRMKDGHIFDANEAFLRFFGYARDEVIGRSSLELKMVEAADRERTVDLMRRHGRITQAEVTVRKKSGERRTVLVSGEVIRLGGEPALLTANFDITDVRAAEAERARADRRFRALFESGADAIVLIGRRGDILDVNPAVEELTGRARQDLVGRNMADLLPAEHLERARGFLRGILRDEVPREPFEIPIDTADGRRRFLDVRARTVREEGQDPYVQIIARDITDRLEMQRRLLDSERLATMGRLASFMAHEINTPLQNIALLSAAAMRLSTEDAVREKIQKAEAQRRLAARIMSDLLDVASASRLNPADTDLRDVVREAVDAVADHRKEGVELVVELGEAPRRARADPLRLHQAVTNLVKNALQATERGRVVVRIEEDPAAFRIVVQDTGTGMTKEVLGRVFEPFFTTKERGAGTGLGLVYARSVAHAHGGTLEVSSEPGQGSTFSLALAKPGTPEVRGGPVPSSGTAAP